MRKATPPFIMYTGMKINKCEFHVHIKYTTIAFTQHSFLEHYLNPEDTMRTKTDYSKLK